MENMHILWETLLCETTPGDQIATKGIIFQENIKSRTSLTKSITLILKLHYLSKGTSKKPVSWQLALQASSEKPSENGWFQCCINYSTAQIKGEGFPTHAEQLGRPGYQAWKQQNGITWGYWGQNRIQVNNVSSRILKVKKFWNLFFFFFFNSFGGSRECCQNSLRFLATLIHLRAHCWLRGTSLDPWEQLKNPGSQNSPEKWSQSHPRPPRTSLASFSFWSH